jgi:hypothetical protein
VSSPSDPHPYTEPMGPAQPSTQEIPVAPPAVGAHSAGAHAATTELPPHPGAVAPAPVDPPHPTGPVDFVPGLPALGTPPVPPPASAPTAPPLDQAGSGPVWPATLESEAAPGRAAEQRRISAPRNRAALLGLGLAVLSLVLLELGLTLDFDDRSYWSALPLWSAFATLCGVLGVLAFAASLPSGSRIRSGAAWRIAAGGVAGIAVFWLLVVLPVVASDRGFLLTAALGALGFALWVGRGRKG